MHTSKDFAVVWNAGYRTDYVEYCIADVKTETRNLLIHVCMRDRFWGPGRCG